MTFPRRLTPSDRERATIVQQRMAPGGAIGVGSRHVRSGQRPLSGSGLNGSGGGVRAIGNFAFTGSAGTVSSYIGVGPVDASFGNIDQWVSTDSGTLSLVRAGLYLVTARADFPSAVTVGTYCSMQVFLAADNLLVGNISGAKVNDWATEFTTASRPFYLTESCDVHFLASCTDHAAVLNVGGVVTVLAFGDDLNP